LAIVAADGAKIAGAEECRDIAFPVGMKLHAESREAKVLWQRSAVQSGFGKIEEFGIVANLLRAAVDDFIHAYRFAKHFAAVKKLNAKVTRRIAPQRMIRTKSNRLVAIVAEAKQRFRERSRRRLMVFLGQRARPTL